MNSIRRITDTGRMLTSVSNLPHRPIRVIAREIASDFYLRGKSMPLPMSAYLKPMETVDSINDYFLLDSIEDIVLRFLANASVWRGDKAREIKKELKSILKLVDKEKQHANSQWAYHPDNPETKDL